MNIKTGWKSVLAVILLGWILIFFKPEAALAQEKDLTLKLMLPNEGETFYSGPTSMLYLIPISGLVKSESFGLDQVSVEIAIYQGETLVTSLKATPDSTGAFIIYANVNPGAYTQDFAAEYITCGDVCHFNPSNQFQRDDWVPSLDLPPGPMRIVVTATDPTGSTASVQRNITVDLSNFAIVPVQIELVGNQDLPLENIPITGTTWLYMWRSRSATGGTDSNGMAYVKVEALAQAPTNYRFQVLPSVLNGVLYESVAPVEIVLAPGALESPPITLQVRTKAGTVRGQVSGNIPSDQVKIWMIQESDGEARTTALAPNGSFVFENIPISEYMITTDPDFLATHGFEMAGKTIDLSQNISPTVALHSVPLEGNSCQGAVRDTDGNKLPFAQITIEKLDCVQEVMPDSGAFNLYGLPAGTVTIVADAPGYYSQAQAINPASDECADLDFTLVRHPDTRSLPWGDGEIVASPETKFSLSGQHLFLERGWLWGQNNTDSPMAIQTGRIEISLTSGNFVLEDIPGEHTWLYLFDGNGTINFNNGAKIIPIQAEQMVVLDENSPMSVVPYDPIVVKTFHIDDQLPISTVFEPTLIAQISNRLAMIGINFAKLVTFVTYALILVSFILVPMIMLIRWQRLKRKTLH